MTDQLKVRHDAFGNPITVCKCPTCGAPAEREEVEGAYDSRTTYKYAVAHASSATTNPQESSSRLVDARDALRWRALCELIDSDDTVYTHLITVINDAFNLGSGALERHIDQAIAGRRGDGHG